MIYRMRGDFTQLTTRALGKLRGQKRFISQEVISQERASVGVTLMVGSSPVAGRGVRQAKIGVGLVLSLAILLIGNWAGAEMFYQGRLYNQNKQPLVWPYIKIHARVFVPVPSQASCYLWYEQHNVNTQNSRGYFSIPLGLGSNQATVTGLSQWEDLWQKSQTTACLTELVPPTVTSRSVSLVSAERWLQLGVERISLDNTSLGLQWFPPEKLGAVPQATRSQLAERAKGIELETPPAAKQILRWDGSKWVAEHLEANDIPNLDASKISSGTLSVDRLPTNIPAGHIAGTLAWSQLPAPLSGACSDGKILKRSGGAWMCADDVGLTTEEDPTVKRFAKEEVGSGLMVDGTSNQLKLKADNNFFDYSSAGELRLKSDSVGAYQLKTESVTSVAIKDGSIVNADISDTAAIADMKLASITTPGKVSGNAITSGTIGGSTAISTSGAIQTSGNITGTGKLGVGTASPHVSAVVDISSTTGGLLLPRMTTAQRDAISSPANGLQIYNTTTNQIQYYNGSSWQSLGVAGSGVQQVNTGTGLTGGPITSMGTISLANTSVTPGSYGSATQISTFSVDAQGRLTAAGQVTVTPAWSSVIGKPTTISGYGITDAVRNAGGTPSVQSGLNASRPTAGIVGRVYIATDSNKIYRDNGTTWTVIGTTNASDLSAGTLSAARLPAFTGDVTSSEGTATLTIGAGAVDTDKIKDAAVTSVKISDAAITNVKIADGGVSNSKIADNSINSVKIMNGTIMDEDISTTASISPQKLGTAGAQAGQVLTVVLDGANLRWQAKELGRENCPSGFALVGLAGSRESFCISASAEPATNFGNAVLNCHYKGARLCEVGEWLRACVSNSPNNMAPTLSQGEWVAEAHEADSWSNNYLYRVMGNSGSCTNFAAIDRLQSRAYRCCMR